MTPTESSLVIAAAGGDKAFGELLGIDNVPRYQQRINNWKRRGIPPAVLVDHFETIRQLRAKAQADTVMDESGSQECA